MSGDVSTSDISARDLRLQSSPSVRTNLFARGHEREYVITQYVISKTKCGSGFIHARCRDAIFAVVIKHLKGEVNSFIRMNPLTLREISFNTQK